MKLRKIAKRQMRLSAGGAKYSWLRLRTWRIWSNNHYLWPRGLNKPRGAR